MRHGYISKMKESQSGSKMDFLFQNYLKKQSLQKKTMFDITWSRSGIKSVTILGQNQKFNKQFFSNHVLQQLSDKIVNRRKYFHCDNCTSHLVPEKFKELNIKRLRHPPYSPDLAPSDFFLFGYLKKIIEGMSFHDENELFQRISEILYSIPQQLFINAYKEWIERLNLVIILKGDYIIK